MAKKIKSKKKFLALFCVALLVIFCTIVLSLKKESKNACFNGEVAPEIYMRKYVVKQGDSLIGIATKELGSSSRVNEIIAINKPSYKEIWDKSFFIDVGFTLFLPPDDIKQTRGMLSSFGGEICDINENSNISLSQQGSCNKPLIKALDTNTVYLGKTNFKKGECVQVIVDSDSNSLLEIISQSPSK